MTFARLFAAFGSILILISPLRYGLRYWTGVQSAPGIGTTVLYSVCLVLLYCALAAFGYALRRWMLFTGEWEHEGLAVLDRGASTPPPLFFAALVSAVLILSSMFAGHIFGEAGVAEALFLSAFTFAGLIAPRALPAPIDPYDPLPRSVPIPPPVFPEPGDGIPLHMAWHFRANPGLDAGAGTEFAVDITASRKRYESYLARDHKTLDWQSYGRFVGDGLSAEVDAAAGQLRDISARHSFGTITEINNALAFGQRFRYVRDIEDKKVDEYPRFPIETMVDDRGDCEDHAIVSAACLLRMGYEVCLIAVEYQSGSAHMVLGVAAADDLPDAFFLRDAATGKRYYYCEVSTDAGSRDPAGRSFRIGEAPDIGQQKSLTIIPITDSGLAEERSSATGVGIETTAGGNTHYVDHQAASN